MKILISARLSSTRLPRKHLLDMCGISMIEHVIARCIHFGFDPILCVPTEETDQWRECRIPQIAAGDSLDTTKRVKQIAEHNGIQKFHHLDGDDPFFCPELVRRSLSQSDNFGTVIAPSISQAGAALCGTTYGPGKDIMVIEDNYKRPWPQRLTLDYIEDYHLILAVNRMVGYMAPRWAIDDLFVKNPDLHKINWFRNAEWKANQRKEANDTAS